MQLITRLKIILQSKKFYGLMILGLIVYVLITTVFIKYTSHIKDGDYLEGIISSISYEDDKVTFILKGKEKVRCNYYVKNYHEDLLGKKVRVEGKIVSNYNNTIPNTFNYRKYLYNNRIYTSYEVSNLQIIKDANLFYKIKSLLINHINGYEAKTQKYLQLFILGNKDYLEDDLYDIYRNNGIWHLFAISGMHIGLIILILDKSLKRVRHKKGIIIAFLIFYLFLTGFTASVKRASYFYTIKSVLEHFDIKLKPILILFLTAFVIIILEPFSVYNVGFLYSFIITFGIMLMSSKIKGNYFKKILQISLISTLISLPITASLNYEVNLLSILLNLFYVPLVTLVVFPLSFLTLILPFCNLLFKVAIFILEGTNQLLAHASIIINIPKMPLVIIIMYYGILYLFYRINKPKILLLLVLVGLINFLLPKWDFHYYVYYLDVGEGDSSIIITPYQRQVIMIDTGGSVYSDYHVSDNIMLFLKSLGITKIDYLLLSHGDFDHMGESIHLINNFKVKDVIFNCGSDSELETELFKVLTQEKISYQKCLNKIKMGKDELLFLNTKLYSDENDNSNIIYTKLGNQSFLFMGDASINVENELIKQYNLQDITVLKVGHHGSKTSTSREFISKITPFYSVISVGRNNIYGHPTEEVLENLSKSHVYRTDFDGTIRFKIKNNHLDVTTYTP